MIAMPSTYLACLLNWAKDGQSIGQSDRAAIHVQDFLEIFETFSHDEISLFEKTISIASNPCYHECLVNKQKNGIDEKKKDEEKLDRNATLMTQSLRRNNVRGPWVYYRENI
jgi:hypothetical protein